MTRSIQKRLLRLVEKGNAYALIQGSWQTGKTTFLFQLRKCLAKDHLQVVYIPLQSTSGLRPAQFYNELAAQTADQLKLGTETVDNQLALVRFFKKAAGKKDLVLLLDDVDLVEASHRFEFFQALRSLNSLSVESSEGRGSLSVVMTLTRMLHIEKGPGSPLFNVYLNCQLEDFNLDQVVTLAGDLNFASTVYAWTGGHPYFTQKLLAQMGQNEGRLPDMKAFIAEDPLLDHIERFLKDRLGDVHLSPLMSRKDSGFALLRDIGLLKSNGEMRNLLFQRRFQPHPLTATRQFPETGKGSKVLPVTLTRWMVEGLGPMASKDAEALPADVPWIFLTGENAIGKTCFLQALAVALNGGRGAEQLIDNNTRLSVELQVEGQSHLSSFVDGKHYGGFYRVVGYGPARLRFVSEAEEDFEKSKRIPVYSLFKQRGVLLDLERDWIKDQRILALGGREPEAGIAEARINLVLDLLGRLMPQVDRVALDDRSRIVFWAGDRPADHRQLAAGPKSIYAMIGDMIIRLFAGQPEITDPSELCGLVLIDELENHLHPNWQVRLPVLLSEHFPNVQFVASTHSSIPLLGAPAGSVFLKIVQDRESGLSDVVRIDEELAGMTPDLLLTSPLFDMQDITGIHSGASPNPRANWSAHQQAEKVDHALANVAAMLADYKKQKEQPGD
ncbi:MAG: AAA family ATPase [Acidobacteriota bacterium]|nr:AAA family ATPase [Acidobacteriota bacterium]